MTRTTVRYLAVGALLFAIDFSVTKVLLEYAHQRLEVAQWTGRLAGAGAGYWLHRAYTFANRGPLADTARTRYMLVAAGLWFVSPLLLRVAMVATPASLLLAKVFTEGVLVGASYLLLRYFVFTSPGKP